MTNFNYFKFGITLFIIGVFLIVFYRNYASINSALFPAENTEVSIPKPNNIKVPSDFLDHKQRKSSSIDFSKRSTSLNFSNSNKSVSYIRDSEYKPISKDAYINKAKYAQDDASCSYWLQQYKETPNGHNKVEFDKACNGFIISNAIKR